MAALRLFAAARDEAGTNRDEFAAATVGELLDRAAARYGTAFGAVLERSQVWCNGEVATRDQPVTPSDEVAILPPLAGG